VPRIDAELIARFAAMCMEKTSLNEVERIEVARMAQGLSSLESASIAGASPGSIRVRRRRIYQKLGVSSAVDVISSLLGEALVLLARGELLELSASPPKPRRDSYDTT
jgi:DNA-binding CsgD family transcriptional regulator